MTPELAPPLLTTTPHQWEDISALDRFKVHRCPTRRIFSGTRLELVTRHATIRYLYHSATTATFISLGQLFVDQYLACDILMWKGQMSLMYAFLLQGKLKQQQQKKLTSKEVARLEEKNFCSFNYYIDIST
ncbi:uncharacterized protein TNCV_2251221 [Trichonephila clavipes]|nr:uncharacterized protein TNCV_2251221 [Trichonephila clavipes]